MGSIDLKSSIKKCSEKGDRYFYKPFFIGLNINFILGTDSILLCLIHYVFTLTFYSTKNERYDRPRICRRFVDYISQNLFLVHMLYRNPAIRIGCCVCLQTNKCVLRSAECSKKGF